MPKSYMGILKFKFLTSQQSKILSSMWKKLTEPKEIILNSRSGIPNHRKHHYFSWCRRLLWLLLLITKTLHMLSL